MEQVIVIGSSAAGFSAACLLVPLASRGLSVCLLSKDAHLPYHAGKLIEYIAGGAGDKDFFFYDEAYYRTHAFNIRKDSEVARIDTRKKRVILKNNTKLAYDYLIIASGQEIQRPDIPGKSKEGVYTLNSLQDALVIRERLAITPLVCVAGEQSRCVRFLQSHAFADKEIKILSGSKPEVFAVSDKVEWLKDIECAECIGESAQLQAIKLSNGKAIGTSMVVFVGPGRPATGYLKESGITLKEGFVVVDEAMRTNIEGVFACGSAAAQGPVLSLENNWDVCCAQGARAAQEIITLFEKKNSPCAQAF